MPTSVCCCPKGFYIATGGDNCIKVWDYKMEDSQVYNNCKLLMQVQLAF